MADSHDAALAKLLRAHPWRVEVILVAALVLLITVIGWIVVRGVVEDQRAQSIAACLALNGSKAADRANAHLANEGLRSLSPHPPHRSTLNVIDTRKRLIGALQPVSCEELYR